MEAGALAVGNLIGFVIGVLIGGLVGGLLIMLGSKIVMGSSAKFGSAFLGAIAAAIAGACIGFVIGLVIGMAAPNLLNMAQIIALVIGFFITPVIYTAIVRTNDGRAPTYLQGLLIYLIQLAVVAALAALAVMVFHVPIPGLPTF